MDVRGKEADMAHSGYKCTGYTNKSAVCLSAGRSCPFLSSPPLRTPRAASGPPVVPVAAVSDCIALPQPQQRRAKQCNPTEEALHPNPTQDRAVCRSVQVRPEQRNHRELDGRYIVGGTVDASASQMPHRAALLLRVD